MCFERSKRSTVKNFDSDLADDIFDDATLKKKQKSFKLGTIEHSLSYS